MAWLSDTATGKRECKFIHHLCKEENVASQGREIFHHLLSCQPGIPPKPGMTQVTEAGNTTKETMGYFLEAPNFVGIRYNFVDFGQRGGQSARISLQCYHAGNCKKHWEGESWGMNTERTGT